MATSVRWIASTIAAGLIAAYVFLALVGAGKQFAQSLLEFIVGAGVFVLLLIVSAKLVEPAIQKHQSRTQNLAPAFVWLGAMVVLGTALPVLAAFGASAIPLGGF